ncbi:phosphatase PAP2 family protein (plasmid) [Adhaeribacter swui]|uniref:Phosphatase PAP2 family protein n=1 Tax=Adhaeribacter swui TaxID=2086471 RepID=A0A7G7G217_9BACT|nr:phosphatase PAP2 family protein [Adhaeribacter swui]QNF31201.1 phosphatase PAP2 family protein [Adhaeribacter swui]
MINQLKALDTNLFLYLNGKHHALLDPIMFYASDKLFWVPFYLVLIFIIIRVFKKRSVFVLLAIGLLILVTDQIASHLLKNTIQRLRPSHELALTDLIYLNNGGPGGQYGFVSSHAANAFALATFLALLLPTHFKFLKYILFFWAILVAYSRIYNGVHYPGDVLVAAVLGGVLGGLMNKGILLLFQKNYTNTIVGN